MSEGKAFVSPAIEYLGGASESQASPPPENQFDPSLEEVDLTSERLKSVPDLAACRSSLLSLTLRLNSITSPLTNLDLPRLQRLDLYQNELTSLEGLELLPSLVYLDVSFNETRAAGLAAVARALPNLQELYLINNKIDAVPAGVFHHLPRLRVLELGSNRLREIRNLEPLAGSVEELYLGRNKITELTGLESLVRLKKLSVQDNRLLRIGQTLTTLVQLEELYLSQNGLEELEGLSALVRLRVLDVAQNRLRKLGGVAGLTALHEVWLNNNFLDDWNELRHLASSPGIETLYLEANPIQKDANYRERVLRAFPRLKQLDADELGEVDNDEEMTEKTN